MTIAVATLRGVLLSDGGDDLLGLRLNRASIVSDVVASLAPVTVSSESLPASVL